MDDYEYDEYDEYGADPSDWDDLGTMSDNHAIEDGWADSRDAESHLEDYYADRAEDAHLEAAYEDRFGGE